MEFQIYESASRAGEKLMRPTNQHLPFGVTPSSSKTHAARSRDKHKQTHPVRLVMSDLLASLCHCSSHVTKEWSFL